MDWTFPPIVKSRREGHNGILFIIYHAAIRRLGLASHPRLLLCLAFSYLRYVATPFMTNSTQGMATLFPSAL